MVKCVNPICFVKKRVFMTPAARVVVQKKNLHPVETITIVQDLKGVCIPQSLGWMAMELVLWPNGLERKNKDQICTTLFSQIIFWDHFQMFNEIIFLENRDFLLNCFIPSQFRYQCEILLKFNFGCKFSIFTCAPLKIQRELAWSCNVCRFGLNCHS